jgi:CheY-like chemotaxis protein
MHGEIGIESTPNVGSTFWFIVGFRVAATAGSEKKPAASLEGHRVLVVDDNRTNRKVLVDLLRSWNLQADGADSAPTAVVALESAVKAEQPFQVVLLDQQMPVVDGLQLANTISRDPSLGHPALILLSSSSERLTTTQIQEYGLSVVEMKPVPAARLHAALLRVLGKQPVEKGNGVIAVAAPPGSAQPTNRPSILVAEDNPVNQKVTLQYLKNAGCPADVVSNGRDAIAALQHHPYQLVLMDVQMPVMDGLEASRQIRKAQAEKAPGFTREIHIVAMTANAMSGDREICLAAGMDDYVSKPLTPLGDQRCARQVLHASEFKVAVAAGHRAGGSTRSPLHQAN